MSNLPGKSPLENLLSDGNMGKVICGFLTDGGDRPSLQAGFVSLQHIQHVFDQPQDTLAVHRSAFREAQDLDVSLEQVGELERLRMCSHQCQTAVSTYRNKPLRGTYRALSMSLDHLISQRYGREAKHHRERSRVFKGVLGFTLLGFAMCLTLASLSRPCRIGASIGAGLFLSLFLSTLVCYSNCQHENWMGRIAVTFMRNRHINNPSATAPFLTLPEVRPRKMDPRESQHVLWV